MSEYLTPAQVAEELQVTRRTVYQWLLDGKLRGLKAGKGWRITREAVNKFLEAEQG